MRNSPVKFNTPLFFYVEVSAANRKFTDDLLVKAVYCALLDPKKVVKEKGAAAFSAAQKLAQLEEQRRSKVHICLLISR